MVASCLSAVTAGGASVVGFLSSAIGAVGGYECRACGSGCSGPRSGGRGDGGARVPEGVLVLCYEEEAPKTMLEGSEMDREGFGRRV